MADEMEKEGYKLVAKVDKDAMTPALMEEYKYIDRLGITLDSDTGKAKIYEQTR